MSVLFEAVSILVRIDAIKSRYAGGMEQFIEDIPNDSLCMDSKLARVGFLDPSDGDAYIAFLVEKGLIYKDGNKTVDIVFGSQLRGLEDECDWVELRPFIVESNGVKGTVLSAMLSLDLYENKDENAAFDQLRLSVFPSWKYETSISKDFILDYPGSDNKLEYLYTNDEGLDVYKEIATGRTVYSISSTPPKDLNKKN